MGGLPCVGYDTYTEVFRFDIDKGDLDAVIITPDGRGGIRVRDIVGGVALSRLREATHLLRYERMRKVELLNGRRELRGPPLKWAYCLARRDARGIYEELGAWFGHEKRPSSRNAV